MSDDENGKKVKGGGQSTSCGQPCVEAAGEREGRQARGRVGVVA